MSYQPARATAGSRGFTLIEMLVALLILSIMSALGYGTYRTGRISAERTEAALQRTREIEFGMRVLTMDFAEAVPRPVRDVMGQNRLAAMIGTAGAGKVTATPASLGANTAAGTGSSLLSSSTSTMSFDSGSSFGSSSNTQAIPIVTLTRAGWSNTAGQQRSSLQRVSYALVGDVLKRSYQTSLDTVLANKPVVQDLLTGVKGIAFRYLDSNQTWQNLWPAGSSGTDPLQSRPVAVEIIVEFNDWGAIRRLIEVAG